MGNELRGLQTMLEEISSVPSRASREAADRIGALIQEEFEQGHDPYGQPWADLVETGERSHLTKTGALRASVDVKPLPGSGDQIQIDVDYARYHQTGTRKMVARPILPNAELPESWEKAIDESISNAYRRAVR